jgi:diaminopimelate epimerase
MTKRSQFHKYTAMGNDMIVIDPQQVEFALTPHNAQRICDRHFGIGADGICYGPLGDTQPFNMEFFNPDGTQAEKSGNGLRIFARYLCDAQVASDTQFQISIQGQTSDVIVLDDTFTTFKMSMGRATFRSDTIPATGTPRDIINETLELDNNSYQITCVNVGNPHCVIFTDNLSLEEVKEIGSKLETHPMFPQRANVQWVHVLDEHHIRIEIWERGAGYTLASGTSSCATVCAAIANGFCKSPVTVQMVGGTAIVDVDTHWNNHLTGTVKAIASGSFSDDFLTTLN